MSPSLGTRIERAARRAAFEAFARIGSGSLTVNEPSGIHSFGAGEPNAMIDVNSPAAWPLLVRGSRGLAEGYARGYWDSPDLATLIRVGARNAGTVDAFRRRIRPVLSPLQRAAGTFRPNDRRSSR